MEERKPMAARKRAKKEPPNSPAILAHNQTITPLSKAGTIFAVNKLYPKTLLKTKARNPIIGGTEQHVNKEPSLGQLKECVVGKTFISGSKKRIKEIVTKKLNIKVKTLNTNTGKIENIMPVKHIKSGLMNCYQIRTKSGRKVIISDTTKLFNGRGWKDLTKLSIGDKIVIEDYAH